MRKKSSSDIIELENIYNILKQDFPDEWLLLYEILEVLNNDFSSKWVQDILVSLKKKSKEKSDLGLVVDRSLKLL